MSTKADAPISVSPPSLWVSSSALPVWADGSLCLDTRRVETRKVSADESGIAPRSAQAPPQKTQPAGGTLALFTSSHRRRLVPKWLRLNSSAKNTGRGSKWHSMGVVSAGGCWRSQGKGHGSPPQVAAEFLTSRLQPHCGWKEGLRGFTQLPEKGPTVSDTSRKSLGRGVFSDVIMA